MPADSELATCPVTLAPGILVNPAAFPTNLPLTETFPDEILPETLRLVSVPVLVMFGCALAVTVIAVSAAAAEPQIRPPLPDEVNTCPPVPPVILRLATVPRLTTSPVNVAFPLTVSDERVPSEVIFG